MKNWYEILINGYSWFTDEDIYHSKIKIANKVGGELNEGMYTRNEARQISEQLNDYKVFGFNKRLVHLNRSGIITIH